MRDFYEQGNRCYCIGNHKCDVCIQEEADDWADNGFDDGEDDDE